MSYKDFIKLLGTPSAIIAENENFTSLELLYEFSNITLPKEER